MRLFVFELRKLIFDKRFLYLTLLLIVGVCALFFRNVIFESYIETEEREKIESYIQTSQSYQRTYNMLLESEPDNEQFLFFSELSSEMLGKLYEIRQLIATDDWQTKLTLENEFLELTYTFNEADGQFPITDAEIHESILMNTKLLEENIRPEHPTYTTAMPNFLLILTNLFINFGAILIILLYIGDILSSEFENRSINFLFTQPLNKRAIIHNKWFSSIVTYLFIVIAFFGTAVLLSGILGDDGTFRYPVLIEQNHELTFITVGEYLQQAFFGVSVTILLVISLSLLFGLFFKNTLATLAATAGTIFAGYALSLIPSRILFWLNPFQYVMGEGRILDQNITNWYQGIVAGLLVAILVYLISAWSIKQTRLE